MSFRVISVNVAAVYLVSTPSFIKIFQLVGT